ncbi:MAG: hypothetical protein P1V97_38615, partial [Planctomycetota bacterium]|nr:hypothetical protein [Planctomycetota bacterium]
MNEEMAALERQIAADPSDWGKIERLYAHHERFGLKYRGRSLKQLVKALKGKNPAKTRAYIRSAGIVALPELVKALSDPHPRLVVHAIEHIGELKEQGVAAIPTLDIALLRAEDAIRQALLSTAALLGPEAWALAEKSIRREVELLEESIENEVSFDFDRYIFEGFTGDPMDVEASFHYRFHQSRGQQILQTLLRQLSILACSLKVFLPEFIKLKKRLVGRDSPIHRLL